MKKDKPTSSKKRKTVRIICIIAVILVVLGAGIYQGYRVVRDMALEKMFVMMMDDDYDATSTEGKNGASGGGNDSEQMTIEDAAKAFERLNGVETEDESESTEKGKNPEKPKSTSTNKTADTREMSNEEKANQIVTQISEADKNRAIAIVSSVASVNDCINLYNMAMNGDQNAKNQLKAIYGRFSQAQLDELWSLYEKNKHLL